MASHRSDFAPTRREDALECVLLGVWRSQGSTHGVTSLRFRAHTARRCPGVRSVGGGRVQRLHTWRHTRHIPRPHGPKMPCRLLCWGWGVHRPPHMASHRSDFASTRREDALECVLLGGGAFRGSTHRVTSLRFRVHIARRCPGVRSVGGGAFTGLHTWRHTRHIPRPHGAKMPWSAFCWGWGVSEAPHMASHASHSASTRREDALECVLLGVGAFRGSTHGVTRVTFRVHTARRCPVVRSVGGGAVQRLHTLRHIAQISRLIGPICALYYRGIASAPVTAPFAR